MNNLLIIGAFALVWLWTSTEAVAQQQSFALGGRVTNATPDGTDVAGVTVVLHMNTASGYLEHSTNTDSDGEFHFDSNVFNLSAEYWVSVRFQEALYVYDIDLSVVALETLTITVYDATDKIDSLFSPSTSILFAGTDKSAQTISVLEIVTIVNNSDHTFVPGDDPMNLLRFGLPAGANSLQVDTDLPSADFVQVDRGFALLTSVSPGEHEVMYAYRFPYSRPSVSFTKSFVYGAGHVRMLAPEGAMELSASKMDIQQNITIGNRPYHLLEANDFERGTKVSVLLKNLPESSFGDRSSQLLKDVRFEYTAVVGLGLLMACLIGYSIWRRVKESHRNPSEVL